MLPGAKFIAVVVKLNFIGMEEKNTWTIVMCPVFWNLNA